MLSFVVRWNHKFLAHLDLVGLIYLVAIRIENPHVLIRISVKLFTNLRQIVSAFDFISLSRYAFATTCSRTNSPTRVDADIGGNVVGVWIDEFD